MDTTHTERLHAAAGRGGDITELPEPALGPVTFKLVPVGVVRGQGGDSPSACPCVVQGDSFWISSIGTRGHAAALYLLETGNFLQCVQWKTSWYSVLYDQGGCSSPLWSGQLGLLYQALFLNNQLAHPVRSMKFSRYLEMDILSINHAYYFTI